MRFLFFTFGLLCFSLPVLANSEVKSAQHYGIENTQDDKFWEYYDIHARKFDYIADRNEFRRKLDQRRENYVRYQVNANKQYRSDLRRYYAGIK